MSPFNAYPGVAHAGGEYLLRHLMVLSESMSVTLLTPDTDRGDGPHEPPSWDVLPLGAGSGSAPGRREKVRKFLLGGALPRSAGMALTADPKVRAVVQSADTIDYQWTESVSLDPILRRLNPGASRRLLMHDVLSQRWLRAARKTDRWWRRIAFFARLGTAWLGERRRLRAVSVVGVFSEKDARLLGAWHRRLPRVEVIHPPLVDPDMLRERAVPSARPRKCVLFTGAFDRGENEEGALWLLGHVWPQVSARHDVELVLAGASPSARLVRAASAQGVTVTGYVPSLGPFYAASDLFVAPVLRGAGVKFKVISAMLWGVPVVATDVAAEGIGRGEHYVAVTNDAAAFAAAVSSALEDGDACRLVATAAQTWARDHYGDDQFRMSLARYLSP